MSDDAQYIDFATVRDLLLEANERRQHLTYEQKAALFHAEWAASENRNGIKTDPEVFQSMFSRFAALEALEKYPEIAAKLAEIMPLHPDDVRAVIASKRITVTEDAVRQIIEIVRQEVGIE